MATVNFPDPSASPWTNPDTGITYTYNNGVWSVVSASSPGFVKLDDGGSKQVIQSGGVGISNGTDENITLNANGSAIFAGGKFLVEQTGQFTFDPGSGNGKISTTYGSNTAIYGKQNDNSTDAWRLSGDGSGTFSGVVRSWEGPGNSRVEFNGDGLSGFDDSDASKFSFNADTGEGIFRGDVSIAQAGSSNYCELKTTGEANFTGIVKTTNYFHSEGNSAGNTAFYATENGAGNVIISHGGTATFAGKVTSTDPDIAFFANPTLNAGGTVFRSAVQQAGSSSQYHFYGTSTTSGEAVSISTNGNATFTKVTADSTTNSSRIQALVSNSTAANTGCLVVYNKDTTQSPVNITANGNATFAGAVQAATFNMETLPVLQP